LRGALDRADDAIVAAAAADVDVEGAADVVAGGAGVAVEQGLGGDDQPGGAVAALGGLFGDEGALEGVGVQIFKGGDFGLGYRSDRDRAGGYGLSVDQHLASPALLQPAAKLGGFEPEVVAQDLQQRGVWIDVEAIGLPVDL